MRALHRANDARADAASAADDEMVVQFAHFTLTTTLAKRHRRQHREELVAQAQARSCDEARAACGCETHLPTVASKRRSRTRGTVAKREAECQLEVDS